MQKSYSLPKNVPFDTCIGDVDDFDDEGFDLIALIWVIFTKLFVDSIHTTCSSILVTAITVPHRIVLRIPNYECVFPIQF